MADKPDRRVNLWVGGKVRREDLGVKYTPYARSRPEVQNLCGSFTAPLYLGCLQGAVMRNSTTFGYTKSLYHLHGNVTVHDMKASYMGCKGVRAITELARSLKMDTPRNKTHMAVFTFRLGKSAQCTRGGYVETMILRNHAGYMEAMSRGFEENNSTRFTVAYFKGLFDLSPALVPTKNDWTLTCKGVVIGRMTWADMDWTEETERHLLSFCDKMFTIFDENS